MVPKKGVSCKSQTRAVFFTRFLQPTRDSDPGATIGPGADMSSMRLDGDDAIRGLPQVFDEIQFIDETTLEEFKCAICIDTVRDAVYACRNQHLFCAGCLTKHYTTNDRCPACKEPIICESGSTFPGTKCRLVDSVVNRLAAVCPHGCGQKMAFGDLAGHKTTCPKAKVKCVFCGESVAREDMDEHMAINANNHLFTFNSRVNEAMHDTKIAVDQVRSLVHQSYKTSGDVMLDQFKILYENQRRIQEQMLRIEEQQNSQSSMVLNTLTHLTSLMQGSQGSADGKRKARDTTTVTATAVSTPPAKQNRDHFEAPPAPRVNRHSRFSLLRLRDRMPELEDRGLFSNEEDDNLSRRNGGRSPSPDYSMPGSLRIRSPEYEPAGGDDSPPRYRGGLSF